MDGWMDDKWMDGWMDGRQACGVDGLKFPSSLIRGISSEVCSAKAPRERSPSEPHLEGG